MHHTSQILEQDSSPFVLTATLLESAIQKQLNLGKKVKGFFFCNPNNPLGEIYSPDLTIQLMKVCAKYEMHFIVDEIYALSVHNYERKDSFQSVLTIPKSQVTIIKEEVVLKIHLNSASRSSEDTFVVGAE